MPRIFPILGLPRMIEGFAEKLVTAREEAGLTLDAVVDAAANLRWCHPISRGALSRWENGESEPVYSQVVALARIYVRTLNYFGGALTDGREDSEMVHELRERLTRALRFQSEVERARKRMLE